jgi:chemotaxis protein MotB
MTMTNTPLKLPLFLLVWALLAAFVSAAWADDLESIRFGDRALAYTSGSIQLSTPQDGVVNLVTGDNQTSGDRMIVGQREAVYLRLQNPNEVMVGDYFTIYKRARKVFHPATGQYLGYLIHRLAIVQVVQADHQLTTVRTIRSYGPVEPGNPVMKFSLPTSGEMTTDESADKEVRGMIVDFQADREMTLVAQRNVVYIDKGWEDGVKPDDRMEVVRVGGNLPPRLVGELKILSTEARTASALVAKSTSRILKGDRVRTKIHAPEATPVSQEMQPIASEPTAVSKEQPMPRKFQVQNVAGETRFNLNDLAKQLRFESGEATIKPDGYRVLDQVVEYLNTEAGEKLIRVEGHADNMEIGPSLKSRYPSNWDLSKARASGVARYILEKSGIDSARMSTVGFGDTRPIISNVTEAGRQQNRRVEVVLYAPEAAEPPSEPATKPVETTDSGYSFSSLGSQEGAGQASPQEKQSPAVSSVPAEGQAPSTPVPLTDSSSHPPDQPGTTQNPGPPNNSPVPPSQ